ncbi:MAG: tetratricopeptide repeat protein [Candidatus Omnitrophica bacterium]|nr:tetratricopeptide repeat protein [Candidatus Omnitrophota bacterium]
MKQFLFLILVAIVLCDSAQTANAALESSERTRLSPWELQIWNSPAFQKQFTESYIAETDIEPLVTTSERDQMQEVLELISSDKLDEAARVLEKNRGEAVSAVYDFTLANLYFRQEKLEQSAEAYEVAVDKYPKFLRAWRNLGLIYVRQNEFEKALPALTRVVELGGGDALTYGLLGFAHSSVGNYLSAETAYRMAVLVDPETMDWKMGLARSLFKQESYSQAVALCAQLIAEDPDRADLWLLQANAYVGLGQALKAAENYEFVDRLGRSTKDSLNMLGDIYINQELYEMAVDSYIRAMQKDPGGSAERGIRAAKVLAARGALSETKQLVEKIEQLRGDQMDPAEKKDVLKLRARLAVAEGAGEEEARVLEQIVEIDPLDGEALILLGQHSGRAGEPEKAAFYFERAASIEGYEADAKVRHAQLLVRNGKYSEALPLLRRAQFLDPRDDVQEYLEQVERVSKAR